MSRVPAVLSRGLVAVGVAAMALGGSTAAAAHTGSIFMLASPGEGDYRFASVSTTDAAISPLPTNLMASEIEPIGIEIIDDQGLGIGYAAEGTPVIYRWSHTTGAIDPATTPIGIPGVILPPPPEGYTDGGFDDLLIGLDAPDSTTLLSIYFVEQVLEPIDPDGDDEIFQTTFLVSIDIATGAATIIMELPAALVESSFAPFFDVATSPIDGMTRIVAPSVESDGDGGEIVVVLSLTVDRTTGGIVAPPATVAALSTGSFTIVAGADFDPTGTLWLARFGDSGEPSDDVASLIRIPAAPIDLSTLASVTTVGPLVVPPYFPYPTFAYDPAKVLPGTGSAIDRAVIGLGVVFLLGGAIAIAATRRREV